MINLNLSGATRWGLNALLLLSIVVALYLGRTLFIPTVIALLLAAMLVPGVYWMNQTGLSVPLLCLRPHFPWLVPCVVRLRLPWTVACTVAVSSLVFLALFLTVGIGLANIKMIKDLTDAQRQQQVYDDFRTKLEIISPVPLGSYFPARSEDFAIFKAVQRALDPAGDSFIKILAEIAGFGGAWVWQWVLILFILLFLLLEGPMLTRRVVDIFGPSPEVQAKVVQALKNMADQIRTYLVWRTIINFALGILVGFVYKWLGLSQPWTWALVTAVLCYVPYIGPIAAGVPPVIDALVSCDSLWYVAAVLVFYVLIINVEGYLIVPLVMGRHMDLNATTVILSCVFWELVWGPAGLFLAMPVMAAIKAICAHVPGLEAWAYLMSTREPERSEQADVAAGAEVLEDTQLILDPEAEAHLSEQKELLKRKS